MKFRKFEISVVIGLILTLVFSIVSFGATTDNIEKDVLRLHILANSDSEEDQQLKLKVRDAIINLEGEVFDTALDVANAKEKVVKDFDKIRSTAKSVIKANGYDYDVDVRLEKTYFETRYYDEFTLPAGYYEALRVIIGSGEGHNWWCVMYPPLCLNSAEDIKTYKDLSRQEKDLIKSNPKYDIRFKGYEIWKKILRYFEK